MTTSLKRRISLRYIDYFACLVLLMTLLAQGLLSANAKGRSTRLHCYPTVSTSLPCVFLLRDEDSDGDTDHEQGDALVHFTHSGTQVFDALTGETIISSDIPFDPAIPLVYQNQAASVAWSHDGQYMALTSDTEVRLYRRDEQTPIATFPYRGRFQPYAVWSPTANTLAYYSYDGIWLTTIDEGGEASEPFALQLDEDTDVYHVLWSLDGDSLLALISIEQYEYQVQRLNAETGVSQALVAEMTSLMSPSIKWLDNGKLRFCCEIVALGDGPDLDVEPAAAFELGDHFDIDGETWEIVSAPFSFLHLVHESGRYSIRWFEHVPDEYTLAVTDLVENRVVDQWDQVFTSQSHLAPPLEAMWIRDMVVVAGSAVPHMRPDDPDALFVWKPELP